jgi:hypothetical protein
MDANVVYRSIYVNTIMGRLISTSRRQVTDSELVAEGVAARDRPKEAPILGIDLRAKL